MELTEQILAYAAEMGTSMSLACGPVCNEDDSTALLATRAIGEASRVTRKLTPAQILKLYSRRQTNIFTHAVQYFFAGFVALLCLCYVMEEIRLRMSKSSRKRSLAIFQYTKNLLTRISYMSFKLPIIRARVYAPISIAWVIFAGVLTVAIIARTPDVTFKHQFQLRYIAKRSGDIGASMLPMLFFLSMKNSPIGFLVGSSHEKLNIVHRWTGRTLIAVLAVHLVTYTVSYAKTNSLKKLTEIDNVYGILAFSCAILIGISSVAMVRRKAYEVFFVLHWTFTACMLAFTFLHREENEVWVYASVGIIGGDLLLRVLRTWLFSTSFRYVSVAKLQVLNDELVSVTIERPSKGLFRTWSPGSHAFLHIPAVGLHQRHPFTICSIPEEGFLRFVVKKQKGFTATLHSREPNSVRCTVDGSYGSFKVNRFAKYPDVLLIGGGVGITFILPIMKSLLLDASQGVHSLTFVWTTRHTATFEHFAEEVRSIYRAHEKSGSGIVLTINLVYTGRTFSKDDEFRDISESPVLSRGASEDMPAEKKVPIVSLNDYNSGVSTMLSSQERIRVSDIVGRVSVDKDRLAVGVCGPNHLVSDAKRAVSSHLHGSRDIWLYTEDFEW